MKLFDELKTEMITIQQKMTEPKKKEGTVALKKVKELCKEFGLISVMLKGVVAVNENKSNFDLPT